MYKLFQDLYLITFWGFIIVWSLSFICWVLTGLFKKLSTLSNTNNIKKPTNKKSIIDGYVAKSGRVYK